MGRDLVIAEEAGSELEGVALDELHFGRDKKHIRESVALVVVRTGVDAARVPLEVVFVDALGRPARGLIRFIGAHRELREVRIGVAVAISEEKRDARLGRLDVDLDDVGRLAKPEIGRNEDRVIAHRHGRLERERREGVRRHRVSSRRGRSGVSHEHLRIRRVKLLVGVVAGAGGEEEGEKGETVGLHSGAGG